MIWSFYSIWNSAAQAGGGCCSSMGGSVRARLGTLCGQGERLCARYGEDAVLARRRGSMQTLGGCNTNKKIAPYRQSCTEQFFLCYKAIRCGFLFHQPFLLLHQHFSATHDIHSPLALQIINSLSCKVIGMCVPVKVFYCR